MKKVLTFWRSGGSGEGDRRPRHGHKDTGELLRAAQAGSVWRVKHVLLLGTSSLEERDRMQRTALHVACANGHQNVVRFLIRKKCPLDLCDIDNKTALVHAIQCQQDECAAALLDHGADPNVRDVDGNTALHLAVRHENIAMVEKLLSCNADTEAVNKRNLTPVSLANCENKKKMVEFFLKNGSIADQMESNQVVALEHEEEKTFLTSSESRNPVIDQQQFRKQALTETNLNTVKGPEQKEQREKVCETRSAGFQARALQSPLPLELPACVIDQQQFRKQAWTETKVKGPEQKEQREKVCETRSAGFQARALQSPLPLELPACVIDQQQFRKQAWTETKVKGPEQKEQREKVCETRSAGFQARALQSPLPLELPACVIDQQQFRKQAWTETKVKGPEQKEQREKVCETKSAGFQARALQSPLPLELPACVINQGQSRKQAWTETNVNTVIDQQQFRKQAWTETNLDTVKGPEQNEQREKVCETKSAGFQARAFQSPLPLELPGCVYENSEEDTKNSLSSKSGIDDSRLTSDDKDVKDKIISKTCTLTAKTPENQSKQGHLSPLSLEKVYRESQINRACDKEETSAYSGPPSVQKHEEMWIKQGTLEQGKKVPLTKDELKQKVHVKFKVTDCPEEELLYDNSKEGASLRQMPSNLTSKILDCEGKYAFGTSGSAALPKFPERDEPALKKVSPTRADPGSLEDSPWSTSSELCLSEKELHSEDAHKPDAEHVLNKNEDSFYNDRENRKVRNPIVTSEVKEDQEFDVQMTKNMKPNTTNWKLGIGHTAQPSDPESHPDLQLVHCNATKSMIQIKSYGTSAVTKTYKETKPNLDLLQMSFCVDNCSANNCNSMESKLKDASFPAPSKDRTPNVHADDELKQDIQRLINEIDSVEPLALRKENVRLQREDKVISKTCTLTAKTPKNQSKQSHLSHLSLEKVYRESHRNRTCDKEETFAYSGPPSVQKHEEMWIKQGTLEQGKKVPLTKDELKQKVHVNFKVTDCPGEEPLRDNSKEGASLRQMPSNLTSKVLDCEGKYAFGTSGSAALPKFPEREEPALRKVSPTRADPGSLEDSPWSTSSEFCLSEKELHSENTHKPDAEHVLNKNEENFYNDTEHKKVRNPVVEEDQGFDVLMTKNMKPNATNWKLGIGHTAQPSDPESHPDLRLVRCNATKHMTQMKSHGTSAVTKTYKETKPNLDLLQMPFCADNCSANNCNSMESKLKDASSTAPSKDRTPKAHADEELKRDMQRLKNDSAMISQLQREVEKEKKKQKGSKREVPENTYNAAADDSDGFVQQRNHEQMDSQQLPITDNEDSDRFKRRKREKTKRQKTDLVYEKNRVQLRKKEEHSIKKVEVNPKAETAIRTGDNALVREDKVVEERNYTQRQLSQEENARILQDGILTKHLCKPKEIEIAHKKMNSEVSDRYEKEKHLLHENHMLQSEIAELRLEIDTLKNQNQDMGKKYFEDVVIVKEKNDYLQKTIKLNEETLAKTIFQHNGQLEVLTAENTMLNSKLDNEKQHRERLNSKLENEKQHRERLNSKLENEKQDRERLNSKLENEKQDRERLNSKLENEKQHRERLNSKLENEKQHRERLNSKLENEKQHRERLNSKLENEKQHRERLEAELESYRSRLAIATQYHEQCQTSKRALQLAFQREKDEWLCLQDKMNFDMSNLTYDKEILSQQLSKMESKSNSLEIELHHTRHALRERTLVLEGVERDLSQKRGQKEEPEHVCQKKQGEVSKYTEEEDALQERLSHPHSENALLRRQPDHVHKAGWEKETGINVQDQLQDITEIFKAESEKQGLMLSEIKKELINKLNETKKELVNELNQLKEIIYQYENDKAEKEVVVKQLQQKLSDTQKKLSKAEASLEVESRRCMNLEDEKLELKNELDQIRSQTQEQSTEQSKKYDEFNLSLQSLLHQQMKKNGEFEKEIARLTELLKTTKSMLNACENEKLISSGDSNPSLTEMKTQTKMLKQKNDEIIAKFQPASSKCIHLDEENTLQRELSVEAILKKYEELMNEKEKWKQEAVNLRKHMATNMLERCEVEQHKRMIEGRARQELENTLEQVNLFLQRHRACSEMSEQFMVERNTSIRIQWELRNQDLESEYSKVYDTKRKLEKYEWLYLEELERRKSLENKLTENKQRLSELNIELLLEKQQTSFLQRTLNTRPVLETPCDAYLNNSFVHNSYSTPRGNWQKPTSRPCTSTSLTKMWQEFEDTLTRELKEDAAKFESECSRACPVPSMDQSNSYDDLLLKTKREYVEFLKKKYMI